ncbi:MAG TPA: helix-turn-helix domain-containing protein [Streptosporangiaceae bacterium]|nr:helix-turn-helix domain-containing protein [Streptosporangiaceae bacterium]
MTEIPPPEEEFLTPAEVALMFRVDVKTASRWGREGTVTSIRTPGGHRRFHAAQFRDMLRGEPEGGRPS